VLRRDCRLHVYGLSRSALAVVSRPRTSYLYCTVLVTVLVPAWHSFAGHTLTRPPQRYGKQQVPDEPGGSARYEDVVSASVSATQILYRHCHPSRFCPSPLPTNLCAHPCQCDAVTYHYSNRKHVSKKKSQAAQSEKIPTSNTSVMSGSHTLGKQIPNGFQGKLEIGDFTQP